MLTIDIWVRYAPKIHRPVGHMQTQLYMWISLRTDAVLAITLEYRDKTHVPV